MEGAACVIEGVVVALSQRVQGTGAAKDTALART